MEQYDVRLQAFEEKAAASGSSFYYAFLFLPAPRRAAITAFYAFCREVDDVVSGLARPAVHLGVARAPLRDAVARTAADLTLLGVHAGGLVVEVADDARGLCVRQALRLEVVEGDPGIFARRGSPSGLGVGARGPTQLAHVDLLTLSFPRR